MLIFLLIGLLLGAVAVVFALQNITTITVVFLTWHIQGSLALILLVSVAVGVIISLMVSLPGAIKRNFQIASLKRQNIKLKEELFNNKKELESVRGTHTLAGAASVKA